MSTKPYRGHRRDQALPAVRKQSERALDHDDLPRWLSVEGLADLLGVGTDFVYAAVNNGTWPYHRVGRRFRFTAEDVEQIEALTAVAPVTRWRRTGT